MSQMIFCRVTASVAEVGRRSACPTTGANFQTSAVPVESESNMAVSSSARPKTNRNRELYCHRN
jgi:hypothetical protein